MAVLPTEGGAATRASGPMNYEAALEWLYGTQLFGIKLGLENMERLLEESGLASSLPGRKIIHVAGTNGKGSVCAMAEAVLRADGARTGLFTSPHLVTFRERIRVGGEMIPEEAVAAGLSDLRDQVADWDPHPTFFELTLALAVRHFCESQAEVLLLETGMGGRLDATNALASSVAVITPIGLDHTQWLGDTIAEIAGEKAGIIQEGNPVLSAEQVPEARTVLEQVSAERHAPLRWIRGDDDPLEPGLAGDHQRANAALAVAAARIVRPSLSEKSIQEGLATVDWPARFQRVDPGVVIDGAHNAEAIEALVPTWWEEFGDQEKATVIFGGVESKDTREVLRQLAPIASRWVFVKVASQRGLPTSVLETAWKEISPESAVPVLHAEDAETALDLARSADPKGRILVTGSLYLAGEALAALQGGPPFEVSEQ